MTVCNGENRPGSHIYIYSYLEKEIKRVTGPIVRCLFNQHGVKRCVVIYSVKCSCNEQNDLPAETIKIYIPSLNQNKIKMIISQYPPSILLVVNQRIPDMLLLSYFNKWTIPTVLIQEGLLVDFLPRISLLPLLIHNPRKIWNYINYTLKICRFNGLDRRKLLLDVFNIFITGRKKIGASEELAKADVIAGRALIYDHTWDGFFVKMYGYHKSQFAYIGTTDLALLKDITKNPKEDSTCYICQTLVEDGRYSRRRYGHFIQVLGECLPQDTTLFVKLHPRSDRNLFKVLEDRPNIKFSNDFPYCTKYLGHYSSMLELAYHCSPFIFLWDFADHRIPDYFRKYGYCISDNTKALKTFLSDDYHSLPVPSDYQPLSGNDIAHLNPIGDACEYLFNLHKQSC